MRLIDHDKIPWHGRHGAGLIGGKLDLMWIEIDLGVATAAASLSVLFEGACLVSSYAKYFAWQSVIAVAVMPTLPVAFLASTSISAQIVDDHSHIEHRPGGNCGAEASLQYTPPVR